MKRIRVLAVAAVCSALVMACACGGSGSSASATAKGISVAQQAVEAIDNYLDGKTDASDTRDKLKSLKGEMDYVDDMPQETDEEHAQYVADWCIRMDLTTAEADILLDSYGGDAESYAGIVGLRNEFADAAGMGKR